MRVISWAVLVLASWCGVARGQSPPEDSGVGVVVLQDPLSEPGGSPGCGVGATYSLEATVPGTYELWEAQGGAWSLAGVFVIEDEEVVAVGLAAAVNDAEGTCDWVLCQGMAAMVGVPAAPAGLVRSEAALQAPGGSPFTIRCGTLVPGTTIQTDIDAVRDALGVEVVGEEEPGGLPGGGGGGDGGIGPGNYALGSSCSCPACPLGGRIWIPFFVIGVGNVPGGRQCCATACDAACQKLHQTGDPTQAWAVGQGIWVTCMLCQ